MRTKAPSIGLMLAYATQAERDLVRRLPAGGSATVPPASAAAIRMREGIERLGERLKVLY